jgi:hypothetical protein
MQRPVPRQVPPSQSAFTPQGDPVKPSHLLVLILQWPLAQVGSPPGLVHAPWSAIRQAPELLQASPAVQAAVQQKVGSTGEQTSLAQLVFPAHGCPAASAQAPAPLHACVAVHMPQGSGCPAPTSEQVPAPWHVVQGPEHAAWQQYFCPITAGQMPLAQLAPLLQPKPSAFAQTPAALHAEPSSHEESWVSIGKSTQVPRFPASPQDWHWPALAQAVAQQMPVAPLATQVPLAQRLLLLHACPFARRQ